MCTQLLKLYFERDETSPKPKRSFGVEKNLALLIPNINLKVQ